MNDVVDQSINLINLGKYSESIELINGNKDKYGNTVRNFLNFLEAEIQLNQGKLEENTTFLDSLKADWSAIDTTFIYNALRSTNLVLQGNLQDAQLFISSALGLEERFLNTQLLHPYYWLSFFYNTYGIFNIINSKGEEGKKAFEKSYHYAKKSQNQRRIASALDNLGIAHRQLGDYDNAIIYQKKVLNLRKEIGNPRTIAIARGNLAELYELMGEYSKSLELYQKVREVFEESGSDEELGQLYHNIGRIYYHQEHMVEAKNYLNKAIEYRGKISNPVFMNMTLYYLVIVYSKENPQSAKGYLDRMNSLADQGGAVAKIFLILAEVQYYLEQSEALFDKFELFDNLKWVEENNDYDIEYTYIAKLLKIRILLLTENIDDEQANQILDVVSELEIMLLNKQNPYIRAQLVLLKARVKLVLSDDTVGFQLLKSAAKIAEENSLSRMETIIADEIKSFQSRTTLNKEEYVVRRNELRNLAASIISRIHSK